MSTDLNNPKEFNEVLDRLNREKEQILQIWEHRVRMELPAATRQNELALLNSLPQFLNLMEEALSTESLQRNTEIKMGEVAEEHGENRASLSAYSLEQVLLEYRILREVVFAVLESEKVLTSTKRDILIDTFQLAMSRSASEFFKIKLSVEKLEKIKTESHAKSFKDLQEVTEVAIAKSANFQELISALLEKIITIFQCDIVAIYLLSEDEKELIICASLGLEDDVRAGMRIPAGLGVPGAIMKHEKTSLVINDLEKSKIPGICASLQKRKVRSVVGVQLMADEKVIGCMLIGTLIRRVFIETKIKLFELMAEKIAVAIYNSRLYEKANEELTKFKTDDALRGRLLSLLAHEIRNPLTAAQMSAQLLVRKPHSPSVVKDLSGKVTENIKRADNLVKDLLDVNRTLSGRTISLEMEECEINSIVLKAIASLVSIEGDHFVYEPSDNLVTGFWSPSELQRALEQLLKTCIRWTDNTAPIVISTHIVDEKVEIHLNSEGPNLPSRNLQTIQELLQLSETGTEQATKREGALELILAQGIISTHGGEVKLFCEKGCGMNVIITLPIDARPSEKVAA